MTGVRAELSEGLLLGTGTVSYGVAVPYSINLVGITVHSQSACLAPGFNPFGAVTSNGVRQTIGTVP